MIQNQRLASQKEELFHKSLNFILTGKKYIGLYDGYGTLITKLSSVNEEDFFTSLVLPSRNFQLMTIRHIGKATVI